MHRLRISLCACSALLMFLAGTPASALAASEGSGPLLGKEIDFTPNQPDLIGDADIPVGPDLATQLGSSRDARGENHGSVQINDPALDNIQVFPGTRPFEESVQSETSMVTFGRNVVVGYNSSADQPLVLTPAGLFFTHRHLSGYSFSHDGGRTWTSGFIPPSPGSLFTFGDPALAVDRAGNFYYASIGADAAGSSDITVSKSTDGGSTFAPAVIVTLDPGADKEWIAVGADPAHPERDNVYVTWTSFKAASSQLMLAKSTDGGATFSSRSLFAPVDNTVMSAFIQFTQPTVDASNGRLYIPFLHFSDFDADFIKVLVSDDGGANFHFLRFNVPGAPDAFGFPNVTPGTVADCGKNNGGIRLILHSGANIGGGRFGLPRFVHATRLVTQPSSAAHDGRLFIAINSSTSPISGDPAAKSEIHMLFSPDGGQSFQVSVVAAATAADPQHVHPALSIDRQGRHVSIGYYVQQANDQLRVDLANGQVTGHRVVWGEDVQNLSPAFDLTPSNIPLPTATNPFATTNYDRTIRACYDIGEYMSTTYSHERVLAAWGDNRNSWTSPAGSPAVGIHSQPDVFASLSTA